MMIGVTNSPVWMCESDGPPEWDADSAPPETTQGGWIKGLTLMQVYDILWLGRITAGNLDFTGLGFPMAQVGSGDAFRSRGFQDSTPLERVCGWKYIDRQVSVYSQSTYDFGDWRTEILPGENGDTVQIGELYEFFLNAHSWWYDAEAESYCLAFSGGGSFASLQYLWEDGAWRGPLEGGSSAYGVYGFSPEAGNSSGGFRKLVDIVTPWGVIENCAFSDDVSPDPVPIFGTMTASPLSW